MTYVFPVTGVAEVASVCVRSARQTNHRAEKPEPIHCGGHPASGADPLLITTIGAVSSVDPLLITTIGAPLGSDLEPLASEAAVSSQKLKVQHLKMRVSNPRNMPRLDLKVSF